MTWARLFPPVFESGEASVGPRRRLRVVAREMSGRIAVLNRKIAAASPSVGALPAPAGLKKKAKRASKASDVGEGARRKRSPDPSPVEQSGLSALSSATEHTATRSS